MRMERYKLIKEVGDGTFGSVWRALSKQTGEVVAIKKMKKKYYSWEECINLREVKSLRKMNHPNIVKLKEVIREHDILHFVFEYMESNLYQLIRDRGKPFSETEVRNWCFQVFQGLAYMHQHGYFHRDLKPGAVCWHVNPVDSVDTFQSENLLVTKDVIKIADFGLAREITSEPPFTEYVSTRWYRAPEVLLQSPSYTSAVDMWAMGAIMAELFSLRPLFPGSSEADEIYKVCSLMGSPTEDSWANGLLLAMAMNYQFPQFPGVHLSALVPSASKDAVNLMTSLCSWDPCKRPTAVEALQHPFFQNCFYVPPSLRPKSALIRTPPSAGTRGVVEQKFARKFSVHGTLSNSKPTNARVHAGLSPGIPRKLEIDSQDSNNNDKSLKPSVKLSPKYRPPMRNIPSSTNISRSPRSVPNAAEKFSSMSISNDRRHVRQARALPMKARGWHSQRDPILGCSQEIQRSRTFIRKVAG